MVGFCCCNCYCRLCFVLLVFCWCKLCLVQYQLGSVGYVWFHHHFGCILNQTTNLYNPNSKFWIVLCVCSCFVVVFCELCFSNIRTLFGCLSRVVIVVYCCCRYCLIIIYVPKFFFFFFIPFPNVKIILFSWFFWYILLLSFLISL